MSPLKRTYNHNANESFEAVEVFREDSMASTPNKRSQLLNMSGASSSRLNVSGDDFLPVDMFLDESCLSPSSCSISTDDRDPPADDEQTERDIFDKARHYLNPGPVLRFAIYLFGERKLLTFFCVHFMCTMVIFGRLIQCDGIRKCCISTAFLINTVPFTSRDSPFFLDQV